MDAARNVWGKRAAEQAVEQEFVSMGHHENCRGARILAFCRLQVEVMKKLRVTLDW